MPSKYQSGYRNNQKGDIDILHYEKRRTSQNEKSKVGMRLKFFEENAGKSNGNRITNNSDYAEIQDVHHEMNNTEAVAKEPVYAVVDKSKKSSLKKRNAKDIPASDSVNEARIKHDTLRKPKFPVDTRTTFERHYDFDQLQNDNEVEKPNNYSKISSTTAEEKQDTNGTYFVIAYQSANGQVKNRSGSLKKESELAGQDTSPKERTFMSAAEIGNIYQNYPKGLFPTHNKRLSLHKTDETMHSEQENKNGILKNGDKMNARPTEYQEKMKQSKNALQELRKSLSSEEPFEYLNSNAGTKYKSRNSSKRSEDVENKRIPRISDLVEERGKVEKKDSNTSSISNTSNSSALSKKLLLLEERNVKKSPQPSPRRSKKLFVKKFAWPNSNDVDKSRKILEDENNDKPLEKKKVETQQEIQRKRHTIAGVIYTSADVSPASVRSYRSSISTPITLSPNLNLPLSEKPPQTRREKFVTHRNDRPKTLNVPILKETGYKTSKSPSSDGTQTPKSPRSDGLRTPKSQRSDGIRTPSSQSSLMNGESRLVFKMDLDEAYLKQEKKVQQEEFVLYREHGIFIPIKDKKTPKLRRKIDKSLNKWIQTDGPPIRPPKSTTVSTQTGINPCTSCSKKLQTRPWNLPNHLAYGVSQTQSPRSITIGTQTHRKQTKSERCQTSTRHFQTSESQTPALPILQESAVQAITTVKSIEVQTADEDSDIWGIGSGISLDRLIRNEAIKRSQSIGHGIRGSIEKMRERSASIDIISDAQKTTSNQSEATQEQSGSQGSETTGKITTYSWNENGKFVKIFVSYSGIHLIPSKNISVKTNGINLHLTIEEEVSQSEKEENKLSSSEKNSSTDLTGNQTLTSTLHLHRLRRPVACLSYNVQRDMITIMLRKQKQTPWNALIFENSIR
ncbi:uncharacterized protein LOC120347137 [Styela clava]